MTDKLTESELQTLYQDRKKTVTTPGQIKSKVLFTARQAESQHSQARPFNWNIPAAAFCLVALMVLFQLISASNKPYSAKEYTQVQFHTLKTETAPVSLNEHLEQSLKSIQYNHVQQQQTFAFHHRKTAHLIALTEGIELKTCDDTLIKISSQLLAERHLLKLEKHPFKSGDTVTIEFDAQGRIIAIRNGPNALC